MDAIRERLRNRMRDKGIGDEDYAALAAVTGDSRQQVRRWVLGEIDTIPADYIGRLEQAGWVAARWLVTGREPRDVEPADGDTSPALRLQLVKILLADRDDEVSQQLLDSAARILRGEGAG